MALRTARSVFDETRHTFGAVPHVSGEHVCGLCLGAVNGYPQCYDCFKLFLRSACPRDLRGRVVPMTIAFNPSAWYSALWTYKRAQFLENAPTLAALIFLWITEHRNHLETLLGGAWDLITVVPSKKADALFDEQRLRLAIGLVKPIDDDLQETLRFAPGHEFGRNLYTPEIFQPVRRVHGSRILLIEDTWITGATALSAAGALMDAGARSAVIVPTAREVQLEFWERDGPHPFCDAVRAAEYDLAFWPR
jgi:predicted amidophosphoribosyltransferase